MASRITQCGDRRRAEASRRTRSFISASSFTLVVEGFVIEYSKVLPSATIAQNMAGLSPFPPPLFSRGGPSAGHDRPIRQCDCDGRDQDQRLAEVDLAYEYQADRDPQRGK